AANPLSGVIGLGELLQNYLQQNPEVAQQAMSGLATGLTSLGPTAGFKAIQQTPEAYNRFILEPNRRYAAEDKALAEKYGLDTRLGTGMMLGGPMPRYPNGAPKWLPPEAEEELWQHQMNDPMMWGMIGASAPLKMEKLRLLT
ncbi:MAG: hypothetical protein P8123_09750, partial [bacterium]